MTTYSTQFFAGQVGSSLVGYVAPVGFVSVVRDIELWNSSAAPEDIAVNLLGSSGLYLAGIVTKKALGENETFQWEGRVVMTPNQRLFIAGTAYPFGVVISGYQLSA